MKKTVPDPLVSIIIPAYNAEAFIADTIASALAQTWPRKEIIVVDDGSTDRTLWVAEMFLSPEVTVVSQPNSGAAAARNAGYRRAKGDYIQFLDADDLLSPDKIAGQVQLLAGTANGCVASCAWGRFYDHPQHAVFHESPLWRDYPPADFLATAYNQVLMMQPNVWLTPRAVIEKAGLWDERLSLNDDGEYFARVVLASAGIRFCSGPRVYYRSGIAGSLANRKGWAAYRSYLLSVQLCAAHLTAAADNPHTRKAAANLLQQFVYDAYPDFPDLVAEAERGISSYGEPSVKPAGPPRFRVLNRLLPWKIARRLERTTASLGLSKSSFQKSIGRVFAPQSIP